MLPFPIHDGNQILLSEYLFLKRQSKTPVPGHIHQYWGLTDHSGFCIPSGYPPFFYFKCRSRIIEASPMTFYNLHYTELRINLMKHRHRISSFVVFIVRNKKHIVNIFVHGNYFYFDHIVIVRSPFSAPSRNILLYLPRNRFCYRSYPDLWELCIVMSDRSEGGAYLPT